MKNIEPILEVHPDCGASLCKLFIPLCAFFWILLTPAMLWQLAHGRVFQQDDSFLVGLMITANIGLVWSTVAYFKKKKSQLDSPVSMRIDKNGIQLSPMLGRSILWENAASISGNIQKNHGVINEAQLLVTHANGKVQAIDLSSLNKKPELIIEFAKESLRQLRGVSVRDLKDFSDPVQCPECGQMTNSLKAIESGTIVFFLVFNQYKLSQYSCCQPCVKRIFFKDSLINLLTCHFLWPILWLGAVILPQAGKLFFSGHDIKALERSV